MYIVNRLYDETIIVVSAIGPYNGECLHQLSGQVATLIESMGGRVIRINDLTHARIGFLELINALAYEVQGKAGTVTDPRVINLTVTSDPNQQIGVQVVDLMLGRGRSPIFLSLGEALEYARRQADMHKPGRSPELN